jgi:hypothetical protein
LVNAAALLRTYEPGTLIPPPPDHGGDVRRPEARDEGIETMSHRPIRGHAEADRCWGKSLIGSGLVRFSVRQHARAESISKRAPSTTRPSLRFRINELRAAANDYLRDCDPNLSRSLRAIFAEAASSEEYAVAALSLSDGSRDRSGRGNCLSSLTRAPLYTKWSSRTSRG